MKRFLFALVPILVASAPALAQDMPLSQILIDGEGWEKVEGKKSAPPVKIKLTPILAGDGAPFDYDIEFADGKTIRVTSIRGVAIPSKKGAVVNPTASWDEPTAALLTPDGGTLYVGWAAQNYLWAYRVGKDGVLGEPSRYAPLRLKRGQHTIAVTSLATDRDGRIYAATEIGVQVFDPTGRLCGVLTPAALGNPEHLAFEEDRLTLWIGEVKYARKLNTRGAK